MSCAINAQPPGTGNFSLCVATLEHSLINMEKCDETADIHSECIINGLHAPSFHTITEVVAVSEFWLVFFHLSILTPNFSHFSFLAPSISLFPILTLKGTQIKHSTCHLTIHCNKLPLPPRPSATTQMILHLK